jgi:hypothetical protein
LPVYANSLYGKELRAVFRGPKIAVNGKQDKNGTKKICSPRRFLHFSGW